MGRPLYPLSGAPSEVQDSSLRNRRNRLQIKRIGGATNLHGAWDSGIMEANTLTIDNLIEAATVILERDGQTPLSVARYDEWATESFGIAKRLVYPQVADDREITEPESRVAAELIEQRIA